MSEDRIMSAAEADRVDAEASLKLHQGTCVAFWAEPRRDCAECKSWAEHLERTERQIALLTMPGETQEMF